MYSVPFLGNAAQNFIEYLEKQDNEQLKTNGAPIYAKAISIVQSSGTGKSRMLTEVSTSTEAGTSWFDGLGQAGTYVFTLPICLRNPRDPGYPLSDEAVVEFFKKLPKGNDLSVTAHSAIACFIAAAHGTMLTWLQALQNQYECDGKQLLESWHSLMEKGNVTQRRRFFLEVVERATAAGLFSLCFAQRSDLYLAGSRALPGWEKP